MAETLAFNTDIQQLSRIIKARETNVTDSEDEEEYKKDEADDDEAQIASAESEQETKKGTRVIHYGQSAASYKRFRVACDMPLEELKIFMYEQTGVLPEHQEFLTSARDLNNGMRFALQMLNPEVCQDLYMERYLHVKYYETSRFPPFEQEGHDDFYILESASIRGVKKKILFQKGLWDFTDDRIKRMPDGKTSSGKAITDETKVHELASRGENVFSHYRDYRFILIVESAEGKVLRET